MFKKGQSGNPSGRPKGAQSRSRQEMREILNNILSNEIEDIHIALSQMKSDSPREYVNTLLKIVDVLYPSKLGELSPTESPIIFNWCDMSGNVLNFDN